MLKRIEILKSDKVKKKGNIPYCPYGFYPNIGYETLRSLEIEATKLGVKSHCPINYNEKDYYYNADYTFTSGEGLYKKSFYLYHKEYLEEAKAILIKNFKNAIKTLEEYGDFRYEDPVNHYFKEFKKSNYIVSLIDKIREERAKEN